MSSAQEAKLIPSVELESASSDGEAPASGLSRRSVGVMTAVGLGLVAAVAWFSSTPSAVPQRHLKDVLRSHRRSTSRVMRHIRRLADKGKEKDDECDLLEVEAELCDEEDELEGCPTDCLEVFSDMQSLCPPGGKRAAVAKAALKECGDAAETTPAPEAMPEVSSEVEDKCMPILMGFVVACKADQPPPENPKDTFCVDECQSSIKELLDTCSEMLPADADEMLKPLTEMCSEDSCLGHIMNLGMPGSEVAEACGIGADFKDGDEIEKGCDAGCQPTLCGITSSCKTAEDLGIPGVTDEMLEELQTTASKATEECTCETA